VAKPRSTTFLASLLVSLVIGACGKGDDPESSSKPKRPAAATTTSTPAPVVSTAAAEPEDLSRPRYLRVNAQGTLVDAMRFPSVPQSIVEKEVKQTSTRRDAAKLLRRFGVNPNLDRGGEVSFMTASLVDGLGRERLLVVSLFGDADAEGMRNEDDFIVFLATTDDERLIALGSDTVSARTHQSAPIAFDALPLHWSGGDDLVARWSACGGSAPKACHGMRAWTMQRGYPERILDVVGDTPVTIGSEASPPHRVATGLVVLSFDPTPFAYR
jgi:hypothetical protein